MKKILNKKRLIAAVLILGFVSSANAVTYYDSFSTSGSFTEFYTTYPTSACSIHCTVITTYSAFAHIEVDRWISGTPYQVLETYQQYQESGTVRNSISDQPAGIYVTEHYASVGNNASVSMTTTIIW